MNEFFNNTHRQIFTYNKNQPIPPKHQLIKLHEAVQVNPNYQCDQNKEYPFVEMAAINEETKLIDYLGKRKLDSGYAVFKNDDVLFAHITPSTEHGKVTLAKNFKEKYNFNIFCAQKGRAKNGPKKYFRHFFFGHFF